MGKRTAQKDTNIDITSDSQVNSNFPYRWSPASLTFNNYFYLFSYLFIKRITINNIPHLRSPINQRRRAALGRPAIKLLRGGGGGLLLVCGGGGVLGGGGGGVKLVCGRPILAFFVKIFFTNLQGFKLTRTFSKLIDSAYLLQAYWKVRIVKTETTNWQWFEVRHFPTSIHINWWLIVHTLWNRLLLELLLNVFNSL